MAGSGSSTPETKVTSLEGMIDAVEVSMDVYESELGELFNIANGGVVAGTDDGEESTMDISLATVQTTKVQLAQATSELIKGTVDNAVKNIAKLGQKMQGG
jgi:hypothetical protein